jgi:endonuclease G
MLIRKLSFFLFVFFLFENSLVFSQIHAITDDGKKVILYNNGFWEFENASSNHLTIYYPKYKISSAEKVLNHTAYSLSYDTIHHLAKWAIYTLSKENVANKVAERKNKFTPDPLLPYSTNLDKDYKNSGFDKGHLVPAADMAFSETTMNESFYFSNTTPQYPSFNRGIWKKLEDKVRKWAVEKNQIIIITGAIICDSLKSFGEHKISIPYYFYKIIADINYPDKVTMIGFLIPNEKEKSPYNIQHYVVSIDSIEHVTKLDFFSFLKDDIEEKAESKVDLSFWFIKEEE